MDYPGSFCVPVAPRPAVGLTPGKLTLILLVVGFWFLGGAAYLASVAEELKPGEGGTALLAGAACLSLTGFLTFFVPAKLDKLLIRWLIGQRAKHLFDGTHNVELISLTFPRRPGHH